MNLRCGLPKLKRQAAMEESSKEMLTEITKELKGFQVELKDFRNETKQKLADLKIKEVEPQKCEP